MAHDAPAKQGALAEGPAGQRSAPSAADLAVIDAWWRAANYLSVGQIYLLANPLLRDPLAVEHVKPRLLGHFGTTPGLNLVYAHLNRVIRERDLSMIYVCGPGHGGPSITANTWLEGTYSEIYPEVTPDEAGMQQLFRQFSFPGGVPSHAAPEMPGSINEGGELGYSLLHAYGAVFDNPDLIACCVIGDGEAETGALAASWHSNKFLNPGIDGAVLPILHLNGYKIASPALLARIGDDELCRLFEGYGHTPHIVGGDDPEQVHRDLAVTLDRVLDDIAGIQAAWRADGAGTADGSGAASGRGRDPGHARPRWPMIVLRTPKGWTGPGTVDGLQVEGTWRSHQVPLADLAQTPGHLPALEDWMRSYRPVELFDEAGRLRPEIAALSPEGERRMGANPNANGGLLRRDLDLPDFRDYGVEVPRPDGSRSEPTRVLGTWLRDVVARNRHTFRIVGPDETASNRLSAVFEATDRTWVAGSEPGDENLAADGRVMEVLSEHMCQGWLEGYTLTGRHGLFNCYEAFVHIVDSMFNQHAKWLKVTRALDWRASIPSFTYLLSSHVWRQDHNGFSHQDPGFIDHVANKKAEVVRVYLPPDTNTLLAVIDDCLQGVDLINVVVAGKNLMPNWLSMDDAVEHCRAGIGVWEWASTEAPGVDPDVVLGCAGDVPTLETLAAADILRRALPQLRVRVVNVVDLMRLQDHREHPHGLEHEDFDALFTVDRPIVFAYHGYPRLIHELTYRRTNHRNLHVRGYKEEGTTTTPFDMVMLNDLDRYHLVMDVIDRVPRLATTAPELREEMVAQRREARDHTRAFGEDAPEVSGWAWPG